MSRAVVTGHGSRAGYEGQRRPDMGASVIRTRHRRTISARENSPASTRPPRASALHPPPVYGAKLHVPEDHVLHRDSDEDHCEQAREDVGGLEVLAVLVDEPAETAAARRGAEDELRADQGAPGECPADLHPRQDGRQRGGNQDLHHVPDVPQPVVQPDHPQRLAHRLEPGVGAERHRPQHGVDGDEDDARGAEPEPQHRERQKRDGRQRVEHRGARGEEVRADALRARPQHQRGGEREADAVADEQGADREPDLADQIAVDQGQPQRLGRGGEPREHQRLDIEGDGVDLPGDHEADEDRGLAHAVDVPRPLDPGELALDVADVGLAERFDLELRTHVDVRTLRAVHRTAACRRAAHIVCIPQRPTVRSSTFLNTTFSTVMPTRITVNRPANTNGI